MRDEDDLKRKCVNWMKKSPPPNFWYFCPTDHFYSGIPDVIFCALGRFGAVELKHPRGKKEPSKIQLWTHGEIEKACGKVYGECRSFEDFKTFVMSFYKSVDTTTTTKQGRTPQ